MLGKIKWGHLIEGSLIITAFLIPTGLFLSYTAILAGIVSLISVFLFKGCINIRSLPVVYFAPALLFILLLFSLLYTHNMSMGGLNIQIALMLLLFPLFFITIPVAGNTLVNLSHAFIAGFIFTLIRHLFLSISNIPALGYNAFYYTSLAGGQHPTYLSMYACWCIVLSCFLLSSGAWHSRYQAFYYITILLCALAIVFLGSKAGMLTGICIIVYLTIVSFKKPLKIKKSIFLICALIFMLLLQVVVNRYVSNRLSITARNIPLNNKTAVNSVESTNARKASLYASIQLLKKSPFIGYGCGDVQDKLDETYDAMGLTKIKDEHLNSHNQYLQTSLSVGFLGGLLVLTWMGGLFFLHMPLSLRLLTTAFSIIVLINFMFESMLERQMGIMFILFWHCILLKTKTDR